MSAWYFFPVEPPSFDGIDRKNNAPPFSAGARYRLVINADAGEKHMNGIRLIIGCGYLGESLARLWLGSGYRVLATTRGGIARAAYLRALGVEPVVFDMTGTCQLPDAEVVVTAVGFDRSSGHSMREVYVDGLSRLARSFVGRMPRTWLHVSSTSVYGQNDGGWVNESSRTEPAEGSGRVVLDAEETLRTIISNATLLRFGGIYGPGRLLKARAIQAGEVLSGDPDRWLNLIHRDDGASLIARMAESPRAQGAILNVVDREPVRRGHFYAELASLLGLPRPTWEPHPADSPPMPHEGNNRQISSDLLAAWFGEIWNFPSYREGLRASSLGGKAADSKGEMR